MKMNNISIMKEYTDDHCYYLEIIFEDSYLGDQFDMNLSNLYYNIK